MGSVSLSPRQQSLPAIYGENLGIVVALQKLHYWLHGAPKFVVRTDQKALAAIYNSKSLEDLPDELAEIVISTFKYNFTLEHVAGKHNVIADYLSRHPLWEEKEDEAIGPTVTNEFGQEVTIGQHVHLAALHQQAERIYDDPLLQDLRDSEGLDTSY